MTKTKMTKEVFYTTAKTYFTDEAMIAFCDNELAKLAKAKNAPRKDSPRQVENKAIAEQLYAMFQPGAKYTVSDLAKMFNYEYTTQRLTPMLNKFVETGALCKEVVARKVYFFLPEEVETDEE